jgi:hypothetical protein
MPYLLYFLAGLGAGVVLLAALGKMWGDENVPGQLVLSFAIATLIGAAMLYPQIPQKEDPYFLSRLEAGEIDWVPFIFLCLSWLGGTAVAVAVRKKFF